MHDYEGKFRDFMVGWLSLQLRKSELNEEVEALYYAVVDAENDRAAFTETAKVLGEGARMLWDLSRGWYDTTVEMAREMINELRERSIRDFGDVTKFYLYFLNPFKEGCVPGGFEDNLEREICWMFRVFYESAGGATLDPKGWEPYVIVEPSYEDASEIIVLAYPKADPENKVFILQRWYKAWNLRFDNLAELAEELLILREVIGHCANKAILGYRLAQAVAGVMSER
jgi:hypothetical protein